MKACPAKKSALASPSREELTGYMYLVHQVVARVLRKLPPNVLRDDLLAAGTFGLVDALRKSVERGPAFDWYANPHSGRGGRRAARPGLAYPASADSRGSGAGAR